VPVVFVARLKASCKQGGALELGLAHGPRKLATGLPVNAGGASPKPVRLASLWGANGFVGFDSVQPHRDFMASLAGRLGLRLL